MGVPPGGYEPGVSHTIMHSPPLARHLGVTSRAGILSPYDPCSTVT